MAMDRETRLILFKMLNSGVVTRVDGVISTGKEAVVLGGAAHVNADDLTSEVVPVAIKVFKTTLTEFKQRQQFLHGM
jgi:serine/threonine-protein kinase RIO1